jgi:magnesium-transporting ATPase (P-type)
MITGDHAVTASAIADQLGISERPETLTGKDVEHMSDEELAEAVLEVDVFARVAPDHKLRIVRALRSHDQVVAVTGDGVNDGPALKAADIGVAMGGTAPTSPARPATWSSPTTTSSRSPTPSRRAGSSSRTSGR